jgi:flavin reductase (DIM6/NTAB) family NADH-FMN oxidoreductase RutF
MSIDTADFRRAAGTFATGVCVVTASTATGPAGFTCQSFVSLSLEPMLVSFAVTHAGNSWARMADATTFAVTVLSESQQELATRFATTAIDKFAETSWTPGPHGAPLVEGGLAHFEGDVATIARHGDHDVVVLAVHYVDERPGRPLLFARGHFETLA